MKNKPLLHLDINVFIYFFQQDDRYGERARAIFTSLVAGQAEAVTSIITQLELLSLPTSDTAARQLLSLFLETPNLRVKNVTAQIATEAARLRRSYGFRTPDALQLATAIKEKADLFVTNNRKLRRCQEITVSLLRNH